MAEGPAITIGNFDGVHCGHQALVREARRRANFSGSRGGSVVALAFFPHPLQALNPGASPPCLSTFEQRERLLRGAGADEVSILQPTREILRLAPGEFLAQVVEKWRPAAIVEGRDFRFGRGRSGGATDLAEWGRKLGFEAVIVEPVERILTDHAVVTVSSTLTRWLVARGRVEDAVRLLGRPYEIESVIERGHRRGRDLGYPTVNLASQPCLLPGDGIYAGAADLPDGQTRVAAISVGTNPTFQNARRLCEAYLLDFDGWREEYGWPIRLRFTHWLRDQIPFATVDALVAQLERDVARVAALQRQSAEAAPASA